MTAKKSDKPKELVFSAKPKNRRRTHPMPALRHRKKLGPKHADRKRPL